MAEHFDMSFKNREVKMWFMIMVPVFIIGSISMILSDPASRYLPYLIVMAGLATYYIWRFLYRKKMKNKTNSE